MSILRNSANNRFLKAKSKTIFKSSYAETIKKGLSKGYRPKLATVNGRRFKLSGILGDNS